MKTLLRASVCGLAAMAVVAAAAESAPGKIRMMALAHQGLHARASRLPNNSVPAFKAAYAAGAKWIETDFHHLPDGRIVCVHDRVSLRSLSGADRVIAALTAEEVATINIGKAFKTSEPVHMPYLADVLACVPKDAFAQCEIKLFHKDYPAKFDAAVKAAGLSERNIMVSSGSISALKAFHGEKPLYRTLWLGCGNKNDGKPWNVEAAIAAAKAAGVNVLCPGCKMAMKTGVSPEQADRVRAAGLDFRLFGVNSPEQLEYVAKMRVTAFTTDRWLDVFEWAKALPNVEIVRELADPLDELVPVPREAVRLPGEASRESPRVCRAAVPGAPAATADEAYVLEVTPTGTVITASSERGERWARVTLDQLSRLSGGRPPCCRIVDWPQFKWRGFMHDSARNYLELADVKGLIDVMSRAKMNLFHWHLTEYYGWRLESKRYPELQRNEAFFRRYVGKFYTQAEFLEILDYAHARGVTVMPEFDIPGHSLAFRRAFGFKNMQDPGVREKLCDLVDELCALAPGELMPFVHIGGDEADRPNEQVPPGWLEPILNRVRAAGRTAVGWVPGELNGLTGKGGVVGMRWGNSVDVAKTGRIPCLDACGMYIDTLDPFEFLGVATYRRVCPWPAADGERLGAVACAWHDDFAGEGRLTFRNQALVPAMVMFGDSMWRGRDHRAPGTCARVLPRGGDPVLKDAAEFERRMIAQRDRVYGDLPYPFQFLAQTAMRWRVTRADGSLVAADVAGATLTFWQIWTRNDGNLLEDRAGEVVAETWIRSPKDMEIGAWIGFTDYNRDHGRACSGPTPARGQWNRHGATVTINGEKVAPPEWKRPGQTSGPTVKEILGVHELDEIPFEDEEYYMREPTKIRLRQGWNHVRLTVPMTTRTGFYAPWTATFAPLLGTTERPQEVPNLVYSSEPPVILRPASVSRQSP